ncbi:MAG: cytochrome c peroxidase [Verrucomicrobiota bacterium]
MNRQIAAVILCLVAIPLLVLSQGQNNKTTGGKFKPHPQPSPTAEYNPYPAGILPTDLVSEVNRVLAEIDVIENRAVQRWHSLTPPVMTNQPPILKDTGTEAIETLGELMNYDTNIAPGKNQACASCHMPYVAFSGPIPSVNLTMIAYPGTVHFRAGKRSAQRYPYAPFFPVLQYNEVQNAFFGGNFWDSRATGYLLRNPDAEQAQGPPVDTQEMGNPDTACIAYKLSQSPYRTLFELVWGAGSLDIKFPPNTETICSTPGGASAFGGDTMPVKLKPEDRIRATEVYNHWAQSLDAYEQSVQVSAFSSKFDAFVKGSYTMTATEQAGYNLFRGKANCNSCHLDGRGTALTAAQADNSMVAQTNPLFTCFGSSNLGLPLNPRNAFFYQTTPDFVGFTANPFGFGYRDLGLGTFLRSGFGSWASPNASWTQYAPLNDGLMQVSSARNVAMTPPQCPTTEAPGPYFQKEFFHNGYAKSLKQLVHFYNTRDKPGYAYDVTSGHCPDGTVEKVNCWPRPEVSNNIDMTVGNLGLTDEEEDQLVAFMQTLTDGFTRPYPNLDTFTGVCMSGGSASTQGNESLIPTPPLPPCPPEICGVAPLPSPNPIP